MEEEMPKKTSLEETSPGIQISEHEAPNFQETPEEVPFSPEAQDVEVPETSTRKHNKVNKSSKIENLKEEISEMKLLERIIKTQNQTIRNTLDEVRDCFERLAKMHVKE